MKAGEGCERMIVASGDGCTNTLVIPTLQVLQGAEALNAELAPPPFI